MSHTLHINSARLYGAQAPVKDAHYRKFLRQLPCSACGHQTRSMEAAHFGPRGLGQKASDRQCLPLCRKCHRTGLLSYHSLGPTKFAAAHKIDIPALIEKLNQFYEEKL